MLLAHIGEARTPFLVVFAAQRMLGKRLIWSVIIIIAPISNSGFLPPAAFSHKEGFYSEFVHNADWEMSAGLHVTTLVEVKTALHGRYRTVAETTENQVAAMSFDSRYRKIGYLVCRGI